MQVIILRSLPEMPRRHRTATQSWLIAISVLITLCVSCTPFPAPERQLGDNLDLSKGYSFEAGALSNGEARWWQAFGDRQLDGLVGEALAHNLSLQALMARVEQAAALADMAGADLFPMVNGETGISSTRNRSTVGTRQTTTTGNYFLGIMAGYEVDLWGRVRSAGKAEVLAVEASREDLHAASVTIAAEVTAYWVRIISQRWRKQLLARQLDTNLTYLDLVEFRFRKGLASALDVFQQRQLVERVRASLPLIDQQERMMLSEMAVLLGRMPQASPEVSRDDLPGVAELPPAGLPAELLENRPDIRASFKKLAAADQRLASARAARLPALRLTGRAAFDHEQLDGLFDNWLLNLAAGLTAPVIDGGRGKAGVEYADAVTREQLIIYRQTVFNAVLEVENALVREVRLREHLAGLELQLGAARSALDEARSRYIKGLNDYLPVLSQLLAVQDLEQELIGRRTDLLLARVDLHRAVGAAWTGAGLDGPGTSDN